MKKRRETAVLNLKQIYNLDDKKAYAFTKQVYKELSQTVAEILLMVVDRFDIDDAVINSDEIKKQLSIIKDHATNGIILVTGHFSNWELLAHFLAKHGLPMVVVGREGSNKLIDKRITIPFRNSYGNKAVYKDKAMIAMAKTLKSGGNVGMLIDQKTSGTHSAKVKFFGHKASTTLSTAALKLKFNPLVIPVSVVRESRGRYRLYIDSPIDYVASEIDDEKEKLIAMTAKYNAAIEHMILRAPDQWFWMHNRWKW